MKYFIWMFFFFIPFKENERTNEIIANHDIESITIFLGNAEISRKSQVNIPVGKSDVIFKGISSKILKQGVKAYFSDDIKVYSINIENNEDDIKTNKDWVVIQDKIELQTIKYDNIKIAIKTLEKELYFFEENMKLKSGATFTEIEQGAIFFSKKVKTLQERILKESKKLEKIDLQLKDLLLEQTTVKNKLEETDINIRISVINKRAVSCDVKLSYLVSNAVWKPYYSVRTDGKNEDITLEYQAQVYNDTGNDWENKPIVLGLLNPLENIDKPKLNTWVLENDNYNKRDYSGEGKLSKAKGNFNKNIESVSFDVIKVDDLSTRFVINDLHFIPSDATPHLINIKKFVKKADYYTLSIPKVKDGAFVIASIPDWESMGLLDGPISLYYKGAFQGISQLDTQQVENKLDISLGKDDSFTIIRRKISTMSKQKLIGFNIKEELTYELIIKNNKNEQVTIELRDQLPLSVDKNVEVIPLELSNAMLDSASGQLTWSLSLSPNERKKIVLKFSVKYPKSKKGIFKHNRKNLKSPRFF